MSPDRDEKIEDTTVVEPETKKVSYDRTIFNHNARYVKRRFFQDKFGKSAFELKVDQANRKQFNSDEDIV